ncbi:MAG: ABC transporter permease subunit [Anaerobutyricum soehngenii]
MIIRGTPTMVQLLIMFFIVLASSNNKVMVAVITFGVNSGAYVAEIFRSGIMSVDEGQMEAGRSLGLGYTDTMLQIIMPQAIKNCLPALVNESDHVIKRNIHLCKVLYRS